MTAVSYCSWRLFPFTLENLIAKTYKGNNEYTKLNQIRICNHRHHPPSQARSRCNRSSASKVSVLYCQGTYYGVGSTRAAFIYTMMNTCGSIHISNKTMIIIARIMGKVFRSCSSILACFKSSLGRPSLTE